MKKSILVAIIFLASFSMLCLMISCSVADRAPCKNVGLISAIEPNLHQMDIELLFGVRNNTMTGTLNSNTVFLEHGHPVSLADFKAGDVVLVQWKVARNDKIIEFVKKGAEVADFLENQ